MHGTKSAVPNLPQADADGRNPAPVPGTWIEKFDGPLSGKEIIDHGLPLAAVTCTEIFQKHDFAAVMFGK